MELQPGHGCLSKVRVLLDLTKLAFVSEGLTMNDCANAATINMEPASERHLCLASRICPANFAHVGLTKFSDSPACVDRMGDGFKVRRVNTVFVSTSLLHMVKFQSFRDGAIPPFVKDAMCEQATPIPTNDTVPSTLIHRSGPEPAPRIGLNDERSIAYAVAREQFVGVDAFPVGSLREWWGRGRDGFGLRSVPQIVPVNDAIVGMHGFLPPSQARDGAGPGPSQAAPGVLLPPVYPNFPFTTTKVSSYHAA